MAVSAAAPRHCLASGRLTVPKATKYRQICRHLPLLTHRRRSPVVARHGQAARKNWRLPAVRVDRATNSRRTRLYQTNLTGDAHLCTPRGENIYLSLGGGMRKHLNVSTDGEGSSGYGRPSTLTGLFPTI
jgi:hypothetical protein